MLSIEYSLLNAIAKPNQAKICMHLSQLLHVVGPVPAQKVLWGHNSLGGYILWKRKNKVDKAPRFSIRRVIWILLSDTETSAATPPGVIQKK